MKLNKILKTFAMTASLLIVSSCVNQRDIYYKFAYWTDESTSINVLQDYVKEVTNENDEDFIPVEDRIAVFDLDGTLYGEKAPYYAIWQTFVHRALYDTNYVAPADVRSVAEEIEQITQTSSIASHLEADEAVAEAKAFAGMSLREYKQYVQTFLETPASGFNNLRLADAFYRPMVELVRYLQTMDFKIYICSGTDRFWVRAALENHLDIPNYQVIGMDVTLKATNQGETDGLEYVYTSDDEVIRGDQLIIKNVKMNKVSQMSQEIGQQPVLAFGNSSGDYSMCAYCLDNNPYKSKAFMVLADDDVREYGNQAKADSMKTKCDQMGWETISMKNDWKTIYEESVTKSSN